MTVRRLLGAGLLAVAGLVTLPALAESPHGGGEPEPAAAAPVPAPQSEGSERLDVPDASASASAPPRPWLRTAPRPAAAVATVAAAPDRPGWRSLAAVGVVVGLGAAALYTRRKRAVSLPSIPESATRLRVLSTARIGPKASAVVAEVGGRVILLGVTDTNVSRLFVLGEEDGKELPAAALPAPPSALVLPSRSLPVETADADEAMDDDVGDIPGVPRGLASRFSDVLDRALGVKSPPREDFRANPGVAALLAGSVTDVIEAREAPARRPSPGRARYEDQAMGLVARRRRA